MEVLADKLDDTALGDHVDNIAARLSDKDAAYIVVFAESTHDLLKSHIHAAQCEERCKNGLIADLSDNLGERPSFKVRRQLKELVMWPPNQLARSHENTA